MLKTIDRKSGRIKRHRRVRANVSGTPARPRLAVFRSAAHIYAQVIDDSTQRTLAAASTVEKAVRGSVKSTCSADAAVAVGRLVAERTLAGGLDQVVFDRGGYIYHGRVRALADAARAAGLKF
ncbi:MAG: 50S ribosomal protein L18 [Candidatus Dormibacteria bacterium]